MIGTGRLVGNPLMKIFENKGYKFVAVNDQNNQSEIKKIAK